MPADSVDAPRIWFLRHGETHWNAIRRIQGQLESELTETGIAHAQAQARVMPSILAHNPPCYVSPLGRAQQTAQIALGGYCYQTDARLAEAHAGDWQGLLRDDVAVDYADIVTPDMSALEVFLAAPGGEGWDMFNARVLDFLRELSEPTVIVGHGLWGQVMRGHLLGLERADMGHLSNEQACVYVLENGTEQVLR